MVLKQFEELFAQQASFDKPYLALARIHNSFIINLMHIEQVQVTKAGGKLLLKTDLEIPVSRSYVAAFWAAFEAYSAA